MYEERLGEPNEIETLIENILTETSESILKRFRAYDAYENRISRHYLLQENN